MDSQSLESVLFEGKEFLVPELNHNAVFPGQLGYEKRELNKLFAEICLNEQSKVLDAYAGAGISTYLWLREGVSCVVIEKDPEFFSCLEANVVNDKLRLYNEDNLKTLSRLMEENEKFDMIDLDGTGNIHPQLSLSFDLIDNGYMWITTCDYMLVQRNFHRDSLVKRYGEEIIQIYDYTGSKVDRRLDFVDIVTKHFSRIAREKGKEPELLHYAMGRTALRALFAISIDTPQELRRELSKKENYFGPN